VFDVFSVKKMYNITVNTGKKSLIFSENWLSDDDGDGGGGDGGDDDGWWWWMMDDDDDDDELGYSVLNLISGITIPSAASAVLSEHTDSQLW